MVSILDVWFKTTYIKNEKGGWHQSWSSRRDQINADRATGSSSSRTWGKKKKDWPAFSKKQSSSSTAESRTPSSDEETVKVELRSSLLTTVNSATTFWSGWNTFPLCGKASQEVSVYSSHRRAIWELSAPLGTFSPSIAPHPNQMLWADWFSGHKICNSVLRVDIKAYICNPLVPLGMSLLSAMCEMCFVFISHWNVILLSCSNLVCYVIFPQFFIVAE